MQLIVHAPFGDAHQPRLGPGPAQALLHDLRLRAAGRRHRRRRAALARPAAQLPARVASSSTSTPNTAEKLCTAAALRAPMFRIRFRWNANRALLAAAPPGRQARAARHPAHARRRPHGRRVPRAGGLPGEPARGRSSRPTTRSSTRSCATACTRRWTSTGLQTHAPQRSRRGEIRTLAARPARAVAPLPRDPRTPTPTLPRRRPARGAPRPRRRHPRGRCRSPTPARSARSTPRPSRPSRARPGPSRATPTSCTRRCSPWASCPPTGRQPRGTRGSKSWSSKGRAVRITVSEREAWVAMERAEAISTPVLSKAEPTPVPGARAG